MAYEDLKRRVVRLQPKDEGIVALLPDWLCDGEQPTLNEDEKIIKPRGYLALNENGEVYYHD